MRCERTNKNDVGVLLVHACLPALWSRFLPNCVAINQPHTYKGITLALFLNSCTLWRFCIRVPCVELLFTMADVVIIYK